MADASAWLTADPEAYIGEDYAYGFSGLPEDAANVTVTIHAGGVDRVRAVEDGTRFWSDSLRVTKEWGSSGSVVLRWDNGTEAFEEQKPFRVVCPLRCQWDLAEQASAGAVSGYVALALISGAISLIFAGAFAVRWADARGEPAWTTTLSLWLRSRIRRDVLARAKQDPLGHLPDVVADEVRGLEAAIRNLTKQNEAAKQVAFRVRRKLGVLKRRGLAMPVSMEKPPEETPKQAVPEKSDVASPPNPKRAPNPKAKPAKKPAFTRTED